jgi:hypothetical protein
MSMGVYINGMEMPKHGHVVIRIYSDGRVENETTERGIGTAFPIRAGHGRLIDGDAVTQEAYRRLLECEKYGNEFEKPYEILRAIETAKTIVPAEGGGKG